jgi:hypothetical protein
MDLATGNRLDGEPTQTGGRRSDRFLLRALLGAGTATLVNLLTYSAAVIDGVSFRLRGQADVFETFQALTSGFRWVHAYNIAIDTAVPFLLGALVFWWATRWSRSAAIGVLILATGAVVLVLIALPDVGRMTTSALVVLSVMDLVAGAIFVGALLPRCLPLAPPAPEDLEAIRTEVLACDHRVDLLERQERPPNDLRRLVPDRPIPHHVIRGPDDPPARPLVTEAEPEGWLRGHAELLP